MSGALFYPQGHVVLSSIVFAVGSNSDKLLFSRSAANLTPMVAGLYTMSLAVTHFTNQVHVVRVRWQKAKINKIDIGSAGPASQRDNNKIAEPVSKVTNAVVSLADWFVTAGDDGSGAWTIIRE